MQEDFAKDLARVLKSEGGKVNNPKDPGGKTNRGITQRVYTAWLRRQRLKPADVYTIPAAHVAAIYKAEYWDRVQGDALPTGVCYVVFDCAVNSGVSRAVLWLQIALGTVKQDGLMGNDTVKAVDEDPDHDALIGRIIDLRLNFVRHLKTYKTFGKGWEKRYAQVRVIGQQEASGADAPALTFAALGNGKAQLEDAKVAPPTKVATTVATGAGAGGFGSQSLDKLGEFSAIPGVGKLISVGTLLLFLAAGIAGAYLFWAGHKRRQLEEALNVHRDHPAPANDNAEGDEDDDVTALAVHLASTVSAPQATPTAPAVPVGAAPQVSTEKAA